MNIQTRSIMLLLVLLMAAPGCSRFRQMTRRDYTLLRDPFAGDDLNADGIVDAADPPVPGITSDAAGFVAIGEAAPGKATADYSQVAQAAPTDPGRIATRPAMGALPDQTSPANVSTSSDSAPPDMAEMAAFISEQAAASGLTDTADETMADFADFAVKRQQEWEQQVAETEKKATPLTSSIQRVSRTVEVAGSSRPDSRLFNDSPTTAARDAATPLIRSPAAGPTVPSQPPIGDAEPFGRMSAPHQQGPADNGEPPVFDPPEATTDHAATEENPFAAFETESAANPSEDSGRLDEGFNFDSGWRPSNVVRP